MQLRPYQEEILVALREQFKQGKRSVVLYAPTGAGKTEVSIALLNAAHQKNNRSAMLLDRIVLVNQTSERLDKYSIPHGVLQSGHWRFRPYEYIQVCSAQTLERRGKMESVALLIIDECHAVRRQTVEFIKANPDVRVIGLSATPFTKGMGKVYDGIVSTITTKQLVEQKVLVPLRVYIAKEIDMTGAKKVGGEWTSAEASDRGMKIVGDVVTEWIAKTHEIYGGPRKTVVFAAGVSHGIELAKKFQEHGYNFVCVSYRDDDDFKQQAIEDFKRPDSSIHGLIATDILTKGFDNPSVCIGVSARPFSKSLGSHIQQMGRVMRGHEGKEFAVWLDHSGNYLRFREDWEEVFEQGVDKLDEGKEKAKKEPTQKEKEAAKCPVCSALWPSHSDTCYNCGHVRERKNKVIAVEGEMVELTGTASREGKQAFWNEMVWMMRYQGWSRGRASHTYRDKFGVWPKGLGEMNPVAPSPETRKFIDKKLHAFLKKIGRR